MTEHKVFKHTANSTSRDAKAFVSATKGRLGEVLPLQITQEIIDKSQPGTMMYNPISVALNRVLLEFVATISATGSIEPAAAPPWEWVRSYQMGPNLLRWLDAFHRGEAVKPIWIMLDDVTDYSWIVETKGE